MANTDFEVSRTGKRTFDAARLVLLQRWRSAFVILATGTAMQSCSVFSLEQSRASSPALTCSRRVAVSRRLGPVGCGSGLEVRYAPLELEGKVSQVLARSLVASWFGSSQLEIFDAVCPACRR